MEQGNELRRKEEAHEDFEGKQEWLEFKLPAPVARLVQCLVEEAEAAPETLTPALQLAAFFAKACHSDADWRTAQFNLRKVGGMAEAANILEQQ